MLTLTDRYYDIDSEAPLTEMFDRCAGNTCHEFLKKVLAGDYCVELNTVKFRQNT